MLLNDLCPKSMLDLILASFIKSKGRYIIKSFNVEKSKREI